MNNIKKTSKKTAIIIAVIVGIIIVGIFVHRIITDKSDEKEIDVDRISKMLSTTRKTDIFVAGEEINFNNKVNTISIDEVTMDKINGTGDYKVIILNDLNNMVELTENEINLLTELIHTDNYMLIYLGEKYSTTWDNTSYGIANVEGNLCYSYYSWGGVPYRNVGAWTLIDQEASKDYPLMLGETLLLSIEAYLQ